MAHRSFIQNSSAAMSRRLLLGGAVAGTSALVLAACGGTAEGEPEPTVTRVPAEGAPPTPTPVPATPEGAASPAAEATPATGAEPADATPATATVSVGPLIAFDIGWRLGDLATPADAITLTVTPGTSFEVINEGVSLHDFVVDELGIDVDLEAGETATVTIPDDAALGEYEFYCSVPGHAAAGMVGTLVIQEAGAAPESTPAAEDGTTEAEASPAPAAAEEAAAVGPLISFDIGWRLGDVATPADTVTLTMAPGATVELINEGVSLHDFVVDELGIDVDMEPGATTSATIPADAAPGEYEFYCSVPGHAAAGMVGTLVIE